jgi:predicted transcriptional regulator
VDTALNVDLVDAPHVTSRGLCAISSAAPSLGKLDVRHIELDPQSLRHCLAALGHAAH